MNALRIDFETELARGLPSYDAALGNWWLRQSANSAHQRAYRNVARFVHASFQKRLGVVVDYACGPGELLSRLAWRYPRTRFVGLDGSPYMLERARLRIARRGRSVSDRIRLVEAPLPDFSPPGVLADLVVFAFPNIIPAHGSAGFRFAEPQLTAAERHIMRCLARQSCADDSAADARSRYATMLRDRAISLHIRRLLKTGGACVRVEYGSIRREEMSRSQTLRAMMEEGSLDSPVDGRMPRVWFRVLACCYFRSGVIEDVEHQERSGTSGGGYTISVLRAV